MIDINNPRVVVKVEADTTGYDKALGKVTKDLGELEKKAGSASKAVDFLGKKITETGRNMLSGVLQGAVGGLIGGSVGSIVQKIFDPPSNEQLGRWLRTSEFAKSMPKFYTDMKMAELKTADATKALNDELKATDILAQKLIDQFSNRDEMRRYEDQVRAISFAFGTFQVDLFKVGVMLDALRPKWKESLQAMGTAGVSAVPKRQKRAGAGRRRTLDEAYDPADFVSDSDLESDIEAYEAERAELSRFWDDPSGSLESGFARSDTSTASVRKGQLEAIFGPIEEFSAYTEAFGVLESAVSSAMMAWITGSESIGTALKKAIGAGLAAEAVNMGMQALKHGAFALGHLAFGDFPGAAKHGQAAAAFAAGALVIGGAAKSLGGGAAGYGAAGAGAGAGAPAGGGSAGGGGQRTMQPIIIYTGGGAGSGDARTQRREQERLIRNSTPGNGGVYVG